MDDLLLLSPAQTRWIEPFFPCCTACRGWTIRNGVRWRDAPVGYGPQKTIYNRFICWSRLDVLNRILVELSARGGKTDKLMVDATHLKVHRIAASLLKKGSTPMYRTQPRRLDRQAANGLRWQSTPSAAASEGRTGQRSQVRCCRYRNLACGNYLLADRA
ncbi:transposase [Mesorhizobium sp. WSM3224]|uniref:transposase n=1 Tax=Mesorhizobium sp. WSM3224 TaxID=1040986 RepID=UPI000A06B08B|nr:transposase [Mesorhizobium sp. WSM3224]